MAFPTMKSYPMIISQSVISAKKKFPDRVLPFAKSGRFKRSCSQNSILIVASRVPPPVISPLATFRRTGLQLGCRDSSLNNPLRTKLTWAPVFTKTSTTTPLVRTVHAPSSATAARYHAVYGGLSRHATLAHPGASGLRGYGHGWCRSWAGPARPWGSPWSLLLSCHVPCAHTLPLAGRSRGWGWRNCVFRLFWSLLWHPMCLHFL